jgi:hypothetical protein
MPDAMFISATCGSDRTGDSEYEVPEAGEGEANRERPSHATTHATTHEKTHATKTGNTRSIFAMDRTRKRGGRAGETNGRNEDPMVPYSDELVVAGVVEVVVVDVVVVDAGAVDAGVVAADAAWREASAIRCCACVA